MFHVWSLRGAFVLVLVVFLLGSALATPIASQDLNNDELTDEDGRDDVIVHRIHINEEGDGEWRIEIRRKLSTEAEIAGFQSLMDDFEENPDIIFEGLREGLNPILEEASEQTDRDMGISSVERDMQLRSSITGETGVISVNFTWINFAEVNDDRIIVGDVFRDGGLFLDENERLVMNYDDGYEVQGVLPDPSSSAEGAVEWEGQRFFDEGTPYLELKKKPTGLSWVIASLNLSPVSLVAGFIVLMGGFLGGVIVSRRTDLILGVKTEEETDNGGDIQDLLTDEDRVVNMIKEHGGKMKQADLVDETGWSKSKVSMILSDMEEDGKLSKLRLGRENVISLEDED